MDGDALNFFDKILNFFLHNIIFHEVLSNFCFGVPLDSFIGWRLTQYQVEDQYFLDLQVRRTWKNSIFSRIDHFDLKSFLFFRATHALRFYAFSVVGGLQKSFLVRFEEVCLYIFIPPNFHKNWSIAAREFQYLLIFAYIKPLN